MPTLADLVRRPPSVPSVAGLDLRPARRITTPADPAEREADRMAERVGQGRIVAPAASCACGGVCPRCRSMPSAATGPGDTLDRQTRAVMESGFGHDF